MMKVGGLKPTGLFFVCWLVISQNGLLGRLKLIPVCHAKGSSAKKKIVKGFKPGPLVM